MILSHELDDTFPLASWSKGISIPVIPQININSQHFQIWYVTGGRSNVFGRVAFAHSSPVSCVHAPPVSYST